MRYDHTQSAPLYLLLFALASIILTSAWWVGDAWLQIILIGSGGLMFVFGLSFRELHVHDAEDRLEIGFGPLPLFRRSISYDAIASVERGRTTLFDGWGIQISPGGGWTWNLWGFDCVDVHFKKGSRLRIGTDDGERLEAFLNAKVQQTP